MNKHIVKAIAYKDMRAILADSRVWLGMLLLPVLFGMVFPAVVLILARTMEIDSPDLLQMIDKLTQAAGPIFERLNTMDTTNHKLVYLFLNNLLVPIFLLIPVINATMIASNSFVGEKERHTLETLLYAPIDIPSLFAGKVLASFIPSYAAALASFLTCGILAHVIAGPMFDGWFFPSWNWVWLVFWVAPQITITVILISAFVSARVKTFQQAQSVSGMVVLPVILVSVGQAAGLVLLSPAMLAFGGTLLLVLNVWMLYRFAKMNERHRLFESQVH